MDSGRRLNFGWISMSNDVVYDVVSLLSSITAAKTGKGNRSEITHIVYQSASN